MATEKMNFELVLQRLTDLEKLYSGFQKSSKAAKETTEATGKMAKQIQSAVTQAQKLQQALASASGGLGVGQLEKVLARGNPISALKTAAQKGELRNFEAQFDQMFARINNKFAAGMKDAIRSVQSNQVVTLASKTQSIPAGNLPQLNAQIQAQQYRVAQAQIKIDQLKGANDYIYQRNLKKESDALNVLIGKKNELIEAEKKLNMERSRATKVESLLGDGGASLFKIQAGLLVNYQLMSQIFNLFQFGTQYVIQYDKALRDFQAVTETTNTQMKDLSDTFIEVSQSTKFSAVELAQAAITLGQAGLSASEVQKTIAAVATLATASGSDLATSVDVVTSALTVFNLNASEAGRVADVMTASLNLTKLTMDKLQLGIQYAGNAAAEAGTTLEELTAALGAMSNAGIKSGSTLGTGLTQLFVELQNPSKKLMEELKRLGLTLADIDVKALGLTGVVENLSKAGFTSAAAFRALDLRGARAYLAFSRNVDKARELEVLLGMTQAAAKAQETQMLSLSNTAAKLRNTVGASILQIAEPLKNTFIVVLDVVQKLFAALNQIPLVLPVIGTLMTAALGGAIIARVSLLITNLLGLRTAFAALAPTAAAASTAVTGFSLTATTATTTTTLLTRALTFLFRTPMGLFITGVSLLVAAVAGYNAVTGQASERADELKASLDNLNGNYKSTEDTIGSLNSELERLVNRYESLKANSKSLQAEIIASQQKFGAFTNGIRFDTIKTIDDLIRALRNLKGEMATLALEQFKLAAVAETNLRIDEVNNLKKNYTEDRNYSNPFNDRGPVKITRFSNDPAYAKIIENLYGTRGINTNSPKSDLTAGMQTFQTNFNELSKLSGDLLKEQRELSLQDSKKNKSRLKAIGEELAYIDTLKASNTNLYKNVYTLQEVQSKETEQKLSKNAKLSELQARVDKSELDLSTAKSQSNKAAIQNIKKNGKVNISESEFGQIAAESGTTIEEVKAYVANNIEAKANEVVANAGMAYEDMTKSLGKANNEYLGKITEKQKLSLEQIKREVELATQRAQVEIDKLDATMAEINDRERGGLRGKYSDAEVSHMEDMKKDIHTQMMAERIEKINELIPKLVELREQQEAVYTRAQKASDADPKNGAKLQAAIDTYKDYNAAIDEEIKYKQELESLNVSYDAAIGKETVAHMTLSEQIQYTINKYREQMMLQDDLGLNIKENLTGALDGARESFGGFVKDWLTGTKSAGGAFKAFAAKVIESLADMAIKAATNQLFSGILSFASSALGGLSGVKSDISASIKANPKIFNAGGSIPRAAAGMGVDTRDSKLILARPGEFVMRNSAVDMIGRQNLELMNAYGNRTVQRAGNSVGQASQSYSEKNKNTGNPVNVYVVAPEQKPTLTESDVLVTIQKDFAKNGQTIQLLKTVMPR